jgi:hypothetical protein
MRKKWTLRVFLIAIASAIAIFNFIKWYEVKGIRNNGVFVIADVDKIKSATRTGMVVYYTYSYCEKMYSGVTTTSASADDLQDYFSKKRQFYVLIDSLNPDQSQMLFTSGEFEHFGLVYPDSLREYFK